MVPKENGFNQSDIALLLRAHIVTFSGWTATARHGEVIQRQHFCYHGDTICLPKSGYLTTKLHGTSTCGCNWFFCDVFRQSYFHVSYRPRMLAMLISTGKALTVHAKLQIWQP